MYQFVFVVMTKTGDGLSVSAIVLALHQVLGCEQDTELYLLSTHDTVVEAEAAQKRFVNHARTCAQAGLPIRVEGDTDLHFVWIKYDPTENESDEDGVSLYIERSEAGLSASLQPGEEFSVVLATRHEDEAVALHENS